MIVPHPLTSVRHSAARIALWLFLIALIAVGLVIAGDLAAGVAGAAAASAHGSLIGQPALANTCAGSQVPC